MIDPPEKILEAGECGFSYVKNQSTSQNSGRPVLLTAMTGDGLKFDRDLFDGNAVMLRGDGAVKQLRIGEDGHARIGEGKTLFQAGPNTVWGEEGFDIANLCHPERIDETTPMSGKTWAFSDVVMGILVLVLVTCVTRRIVRSRKRVEIRIEDIQTQP